MTRKGREKKREYDDRGAARRLSDEEKRERAVSDWVPKTMGGRLVKAGEVNSLDEYFGRGLRIIEPEIVDALAPSLMEKMVEFRKTSRTTRQGRSFSFRASVLVGDGSAYVGIGTAKDRERYPAIAKATRNAKLSLKKVVRGEGSWEDRSKEPHSVPFKVTGRSSSVEVTLLPAPRGTGLVVGDKIKDVMRFAGVRNVWSKARGNTSSTLDFVSAAVDALAATTRVRVSGDISRKMGERK